MITCCCADQETEELKLLDTNLLGEVQPVIPVQGKEQQQVQEETVTSAPAQFNVTVEREGESFFGMDLSAAGPVLMVSAVADPKSLIGCWNSTCASHLQVVQYDRLVTVNGFAGGNGKETLALLKGSKGQIVLAFERANIFEADINISEGQKLGLKFSAGPNFLLIIDVQDGSVQEYNASAQPPLQIQPGARVISVGGRTGTGKELMSAIDAMTGTAKIQIASWNIS